MLGICRRAKEAAPCLLFSTNHRLSLPDKIKAVFEEGWAEVLFFAGGCRIPEWIFKSTKIIISESTMTDCPVCGKNNPDNQRSCFWCGADLTAAKAVKMEIRAPTEPKPVAKVQVPEPKAMAKFEQPRSQKIEIPSPAAERKIQQAIRQPEQTKDYLKLALIIATIVVIVLAAILFLALGRH